MRPHQAHLLLVDPGLEVGVLEAEEREQGDDDRGRPDHQDHHADRPHRPSVDVMDLRNGPISGKQSK